MKKIALISVAVIATLVLVFFVKDKMGAHSSHQTMSHEQHLSAGTQAPNEVGQAGFAAIAEIVSLLSADPNTDWSKVNINGLREHLVLMDNLVSGAHVKEQEIVGGVSFEVSGSDGVLTAIHQMVPAHALELNKMDEYTATTETTEQGVVLSVVGKSKAVITKIKGLGFFGLMATGSHHQMHHLGMAVGQGHHH